MSDKQGGLAEKMGDFLVWVFDSITVNGTLVVLGLIVVGYLVWQLSLVFGPSKVCFRCRGKGHVGGLLGGRRDCSSCGSKGIRPRIGARKR